MDHFDLTTVSVFFFAMKCDGMDPEDLICMAGNSNAAAAGIGIGLALIAGAIVQCGSCSEQTRKRKVHVVYPSRRHAVTPSRRHATV